MPIAAAGILAGGSLLGGLFGGLSSQNAANTQANASRDALALQQQEFDQTYGNLAPFIASGQATNTAARNLLGIGLTGEYFPGNALNPLANPRAEVPSLPSFSGLTYNMPAFTKKQFQSSPGYQFQLQQGVNAVQNAFNPKQGAISGNMLKGIQQYGTGLANQDWWNAYNAYQQNYQNQYSANEQNLLARYNAQFQKATTGFGLQNELNQEQTQNQIAYFNMLNALSGQGSGTGTQVGQIGANFANSAGANITGGANALAAGQIGFNNNLIGGFSGALNNLTMPVYNPNTGNNTSLLGQLVGGGGGWGSGNSDFSGVAGY